MLRLALPARLNSPQPAAITPTSGFWKAVAISLLLHAVPLIYLEQTAARDPMISAGDEAIEVELVVAVADAPSLSDAEAPLKPQDSEKPEMISVESPASDIKRDKKIEHVANAIDEAWPEIPPVPDPIVLDTVKHEATLATKASPSTLATEQQAQINRSFAARVARHLGRYKKFPPRALHGKSQAHVVITFEIGANGTVQMARLDKGSGSHAIDAEAIAMIWRAAPFPQPAVALQEKTQFTIPVTYRVR